MSKITITDLEVFYCIGVTAGERERPQRLLLTVEMEFDFTKAASTDSINDTINYFEVAQVLLRYGEAKSWNLIEKLAADLADLVMRDFKPAAVSVEVKKFPVPQARHVSVTWTRRGTGARG